VIGYTPHLAKLMAAADVSVVQGGLTTTMELTSLRRPFVYVPLRRHFEQQYHVPWRLDRYGAGRRVDYDLAREPEQLAAVVAAQIGMDPGDFAPVETDGAARAAKHLADLL
jgi:predicted glycosyltransferase